MKILSRLLTYLVCTLFLIQLSYAQIVPSIPFNLTNGSVADATQVMGNFNTIVTDVNANSAKNGINSDITSITGLTTPLASTFGGTVIYTGGTTGGSANAQTVSPTSPSNFALTTGNIVTALAGFSNSGAATLAVDGGAATAMRKKVSSGLVVLVGGEIVTGSSYMWYYDGTFYELLNPSTATNTVMGPGVSVSGDVPTFNGTGGNLIQDGGVLLSALAPLASPALTGTPTAPTASIGTTTTQLATTAFANPATTNGTTGSVTLPGGTIMKWGTITNMTAHQTVAVTYGTAFPTSTDNVQATAFVSGGSGAGTFPMQVSAFSASGLSIFNSDAGTTQSAFWYAIGH